MDNKFKPIYRFIARHKLHSASPVTMQAVCELYNVRYMALSEATLGFGFATSLEALIAVNQRLHSYSKRMVIAHELSHLLLKHPNSFYLCQLNDWWYSHVELEAQKGAALILVPLRPLIELVSQGSTLRELQEAFEVPEELVHLRLKMTRIAC